MAAIIWNLQFPEADGPFTEALAAAMDQSEAPIAIEELSPSDPEQPDPTIYGSRLSGVSSLSRSCLVPPSDGEGPAPEMTCEVPVVKLEGTSRPLIVAGLEAALQGIGATDAREEAERLSLCHSVEADDGPVLRVPLTMGAGLTFGVESASDLLADYDLDLMGKVVVIGDAQAMFERSGDDTAVHWFTADVLNDLLNQRDCVAEAVAGAGD